MAPPPPGLHVPTETAPMDADALELRADVIADRRHCPAMAKT